VQETYLQYGVPSDTAALLASRGLPVSTFRRTSKKNLVTRFDISPEVVDLVRARVRRKPIDSVILETLLERSNYTCCVCRGMKGTSYLVHHIRPFHRSQDNAYTNLAVLCPTCHDLAHRGAGLTLNLTAHEIIRLKDQWEREVKLHNVTAAAKRLDIQDSDFINIPRVAELARQILDRVPPTDPSASEISAILASQEHRRGMLLLERGAMLRMIGTGWQLQDNFVRIFRYMMPYLEFHDLDDLLSRRKIQEPNCVGRFCFFVGGVQGHPFEWKEHSSEGMTLLHLRKKGFVCEWLLDTRFITSTSAAVRLSSRSIIAIYGRIKSIGIQRRSDKEYVKVDIRPYLIGTPTVWLDRTPAVAYWSRDDFGYDLETDLSED
jgi:5-methylcytosine-specific restriction endonuclease McrA